MNDRFTQKVTTFLIALKDVFVDEENRQLPDLPKLELTEKTMQEDMTAMLYALFAFYKIGTEEHDADIVDFLCVCHRLAINRILEEEREKLEKNAKDSE